MVTPSSQGPNQITKAPGGSPAPAPGEYQKSTPDPATAKATDGLSNDRSLRESLPAGTRVSPELEGSQALVSQKISKVAEHVLYGKLLRTQDAATAKSAFCNDLNKEIDYLKVIIDIASADVDKALDNLFKINDLEKKLKNYQDRQGQSSLENAKTELTLMEDLLALYKLVDEQHETHLEHFALGLSLLAEKGAPLADLDVVRITGEIAEKKLELCRLQISDLQARPAPEKGQKPDQLEKAAKADVEKDRRMQDALSESVLKKNNEVLHFFDLTSGKRFEEHVSKHADGIKQEFYRKMSKLGIESPDKLNLGTLRSLTADQLNKINNLCMECSQRLSALPRVSRLPDKKEADLIDAVDKITDQINEATKHNQSIHLPKGGKLSDIERKKSRLGRLSERLRGRSRASKTAMNFIMETVSKAVLDPDAPQSMATAKAVQKFIQAFKANAWAKAQLARNPVHRKTFDAINAKTITYISKMEVEEAAVRTPDLTAKFPALGKAIDNLRGLAVLVRKYPSEEFTKKFNSLNLKFKNLVDQASIYLRALPPGEEPKELFEHSLKLLMNEMNGIKTLVLDEMNKPRTERTEEMQRFYGSSELRQVIIEEISPIVTETKDIDLVCDYLEKMSGEKTMTMEVFPRLEKEPLVYTYPASLADKNGIPQVSIRIPHDIAHRFDGFTYFFESEEIKPSCEKKVGETGEKYL